MSWSPDYAAAQRFADGAVSIVGKRFLLDAHLEAQRESAARVMSRVRGRCPMGCGETLFLGEGGYVTCSWHTCSNPSAASELLASTDSGATA